MTEQWREGFEAGSPADYDEVWNQGEDAGSGCTLDPNAAPPEAGWGSECLLAQNTTGASSAVVGHVHGSSYATTYWLFRFYVDAIASDAGWQTWVYTGSSGWSDAFYVRVLKTGASTFTLRVRFKGSSDVDVDLSGLSFDTTYHLEVRFDASAGAYEVWLNGASQASGALPSGHPASVAIWYVGPQDDAMGLRMYVDDIVINDAERVGVPGGTEHPLAGSAGLTMSGAGALSVARMLSGSAGMSIATSAALTVGSEPPPSVPAYELFIDWNNDGAFTGDYDDVSADVLHRGRRWSLGFGELHDRVPAQGRLSFRLRNDAANQHGAAGLYTPGNAAGPLYGMLAPGRAVRWSVTDAPVLVDGDGAPLPDGSGGYQRGESAERVLWQGVIERIIPDVREQSVTVECVDRVERLLAAETDIALQTDRRSDELVDALLDEAGSDLPRSLDTSPQTFQIAGDAWLPEETTVHAAIRDVCEAGWERFWIDEGGEARFWDTYHPFEEATVAGRLDAAHPAVEVEPRLDAADIYNRIVVTVAQRQTSASNVVLWESGWQFNPRIKRDEFRTFTVRFRDAEGGARLSAENVLDPVKGVDVNASYHSDGGPDDDDANGDFEVYSVDVKGSTAAITLKNTGNSHLWITKLRVRGDAVYTYDEMEVTAEDPASQAAYTGGRPRTLALKLRVGDDERFPGRLADYLLGLYAEPVMRVSVVVLPRGDALTSLIRHTGVMDLLALANTDAGLDGLYRVAHAAHTMNDGVHAVTYTLEPHVDPGYALWGAGEWGTGVWGPF